MFINVVLIEAIRFKVEQQMEGARKDRPAIQNPQFGIPMTAK